MKSFISAILVLIITFSCQAQIKNNFKNGDIIFIESSSGQGKAIQLATKSKYTHVGIVFLENGKPFVYHAVEPVIKSNLDDFLNYSSNNKYLVKRLKDTALLTTDNVNKMKNKAIELLGKHYDIYFNWSESEYYCSEYVWKIYNQFTKLEIGNLRPLKDFDLSSPIVKEIMKKLYGSQIPLDEKMISPADMANSSLLIELK